MSMQQSVPTPIPLRASRPRASAAADVATQHQYYAPDVQPARAPLRQHIDTEALHDSSTWRFWSRRILLGMGIAAILYWLLAMYVVPFATDKLDHWNTGEGRIWQHDFDVGHPGGISHFVTEYYQGHVLIIEIAKNKPTTIHTYVVPVQFVTPPHTPPIITLELRHLNGDQKADLLVWIEGEPSPIPLYNNGQTFQTDAPTTKG
jgi:hypothetical protein